VDRFESLFDLYVNMESSRRVCMYPRIVRFLSLVFEARPIAFQQLLFQRSNQHQVHQDTSVVAVEDPMLLVATWIALADVVEGSGELAFYDRSHRLPHYLFKDGSKRMDFAVDDAAEYARLLDVACQQRGMAYQRFFAKKGDVFFWTADLVHRSHPRTLPDETPRLSCVTHYCPATTTPFWFRHHPDKRQIEAYDMLSGFASLHYKLPAEGKRIGPSSPMIR
jgi:phytanoyl-CoA hydroxylase